MYLTKNYNMKNFYLLFFTFFLFFTNLPSQEFPYYFSVDSSEYLPLENAISLNNGQVWDDPQFTLPLGFEFDFFGQSLNILYLDDWFIGGILSTHDNEAGTSPLLIFYGLDLVDRGYEISDSQSPISFKTVLEDGLSIFKLEFKNAGFYDDDELSSYINLQLWLHEGSNDISIHFGPSSILNPEIIYDEFGGPLVGFDDAYDYDEEELNNFWFLSGDADHPMVKYTDPASLDTITQVISGSPKAGLIYKFSTTPPVNISEPGELSKKVKIYPSIFNEQITIELNDNNWPKQEARYELIDHWGRILETNNLSDKKNSLNTNGLSPGMYFIKIFINQNHSETYRVIKY